MTFSTLRAAALVAALAASAGSALAQPDVTVTPNPLDLGTFSVPGGENPVLTVRNDGTAPLVVSDAFVTDLTGDGSFGEAFSDDVSFPLTLGASESVDLTLVVTPAPGRQNGTLTVESDDPDEPTVVVPITYFGTFVTFDVTPEAIDFGRVFVRLDAGGTPIAPPTVCRPVMISAEGDESGIADQFEIDGPFGASFLFLNQFTVEGVSDLSTFEVPVPVGDTTVINVCYTPSEEGVANVSLAFVVSSFVNPNNGVGFEIDLAAEATTTNLPPVPTGIADGDVIDVVVDTPRTISFSFASPEAGQTTTIEVTSVGEDEDEFFDFSVTTTPGNPATAQLVVSAFNMTGGYPVGDYDLGVEACDDEGECTTLTVTLSIDYPPTQACDFGVSFYINEFRAQPDDNAQSDDNYVQFYSVESGLVDLTGCSLVAFDAVSEEVVVSLPLNFSLLPFGEPNLVAGADFSGALPVGPGAIAVVKGAPALGDDVLTVLDEVVNAIVYRTDSDIFGICGEGMLLQSNVPAVPCDSADGQAALAEALARIGAAVAADGDAGVDLALAVAPNPATRTGTVSFGLAQAGDAHVALFDALGRRVATLAGGPHRAGRHEVRFDASGLPAGVYVVRVVAEGSTQTARLTVVR